MDNFLAKTMVFVLGCVFLSCGSDLSEEEQYKKMTEGVKYKTYSKMSQTALPVVLSQYNGAVNESSVIDAYDMHMLLGVLWSVSLKPDFALAECNLAVESSKENESQERLKSIMAIAMYEKGWVGMGRKNSEEARKYQAEGTVNNIERFGYDFSLGLLAIQEGDLELAQDAFARLEGVTGVTYLTKLAEAGATIQKGEFQSGIDKFKSVGEDPSLPKIEKAYLNRLTESLEKKYKGSTSPTFLLNQLANTVLDVVAEQKEKELAVVVNKLKGFADGISL